MSIHVISFKKLFLVGAATAILVAGSTTALAHERHAVAPNRAATAVCTAYCDADGNGSCDNCRQTTAAHSARCANKAARAACSGSSHGNGCAGKTVCANGGGSHHG